MRHVTCVHPSATPTPLALHASSQCPSGTYATASGLCAAGTYSALGASLRLGLDYSTDTVNSQCVLVSNAALDSLMGWCISELLSLASHYHDHHGRWRHKCYWHHHYA